MSVFIYKNALGIPLALASGVLMGDCCCEDNEFDISVDVSADANGVFSSGPQDTVIDATAEVGTDNVIGIRLTLSYDAYGIPDRFQIIYDGNILADTGYVQYSDTIIVEAEGISPMITIRVLTNDEGTAWEWHATFELNLA